MVEEYLRLSDADGAREATRAELPEIRGADTWAIDTWRQMTSRLGGSRPAEVFAMRARQAGFSLAEEAEAWERVSLVEQIHMALWRRTKQA